MADSIRFCKQLPLGIYHRFAAYAESAGLSERDALISILDRNLRQDPQQYGKLGKPKTATFKQRLAMLMEKGKPYAERAYDRDFTYADQDAWYEIIRQIAQLRHENEAGDAPDTVMRNHYQKELDRLTQQQDHDTEELFNPNITDIFRKDYKDRAERINVLKDRL